MKSNDSGPEKATDRTALYVELPGDMAATDFKQLLAGRVRLENLYVERTTVRTDRGEEIVADGGESVCARCGAVSPPDEKAPPATCAEGSVDDPEHEWTDAETDVVHVVMSRKDRSPHPRLEGVYDNEPAAQAHKRDLAENSFQHSVVAWGVDVRGVQSEYAGGSQ